MSTIDAKPLDRAAVKRVEALKGWPGRGDAPTSTASNSRRGAKVENRSALPFRSDETRTDRHPGYDMVNGVGNVGWTGRGRKKRGSDHDGVCDHHAVYRRRNLHSRV